MKKICIIEDDRLLNEALRISLEKEGYMTSSAFTYQEGRNLIAQNPDLILVDINLPDGNGIELCWQIRSNQDIPTIFLTGRDEEEDMLGAFEAGADDYVVKPFPMRVLMKRVQAVLHRSGDNSAIFLYRGLRILFQQKQVMRGDNMIALTPKEYRLLEYLAKNKGQLLTKNQILEQVWDVDGIFVGENTVSVTINRLRRKIEPDPANPVYIRNVFGQGYMFGS